MDSLLCGLDRLLADDGSLAHRSFGLLSHAASVDSDLRPILIALSERLSVHPAALFAPEHGFFGAEQDMVPAAEEGGSGPPIRSLYGTSEGSLRPIADAFADLDLLVVDLCDVGARYYTFAATAAWATEVALQEGVEVWILDRPNPLGGTVLEGNRRRDGFESFVGAFAIPVRHGLTLAELVLLEAKRSGWSTDGLLVFKLEGWERQAPTAREGWSWRSPSPNIPALETAWVYPGSALFEGTTLSEGRGTTRPFELVGGPGVDGDEVARRMNARSLPGVVYLPTRFRPQFQKHAGEVCSGVEILVTDRSAFASLRAGVELLQCFCEVAPDAFEWRSEAYEFVADRPAIDLLSGSDELRLALDAGTGPSNWLESWHGDEAEFRRERDEVLLYR